MPRRRCGAICCAISGRVWLRRRSDAPPEQKRTRAHRAHAQRPQACRRSRAAHAALRFPPPRARRNRHPCRLRARHLRRLHRADRRRRHALLPHARGAGRRPRHQNRGIARRARRRAQPAANRVPRQSRAAMRLLHAGHIDVVHRLSRPQPAPDHRRNPRSLERPPLPLHRLRRDRQSGRGGGELIRPRESGEGDHAKHGGGARAPR